MNELLILEEYQWRPFALGADDAEFIRTHLGREISIQRSLASAEYLLNPNQFVGVVALPSGRTLQSNPKVPIKNLFMMLAIAFDLDTPFRDEVAQLERLDELLEFVVAHFADLVDSRLHRGLYRDYVEIEENLGVVRGRIQTSQDLQQNTILRHRTYCQYAEFTRDIPENQIVRQTIHHLNGWVRRPDLRLRLRQLDGMLGEVSPTSLPVSALDRMRYHRLNDDYRPIHQLCRLFLHGASLRESEGPIDFRTFLIDMNKLFEKFVAQVLRSSTPPDLDVRPQASGHLDYGHKIRFAVDLLISQFGTPVLVADTKYKRLPGPDAHNADLYQVLAYCTAIQSHQGLLVYPKSELPPLGAYQVRNSEVRIDQLAIDLDVATDAFEHECREFASRFFAMAQPRLALVG